MWIKADPRFVAALALVFVTGVMLRLGLAGSSQCAITELNLGYKVNYGRIQQDVEKVVAAAPSWVDEPTWFKEPAPDSPMNEPGERSGASFDEGKRDTLAQKISSTRRFLINIGVQL